MKKLLVLFIIVISGFGFCAAQPSLEVVGGTSYEWPSSYPAESPLLAKVILKNKGDKTLKIEYIKPSCSCTTAPLEKSSIEPGESIVMNVKTDTKGFSGKVTKTVEIKTNDPEEPIRILSFTFIVRFPLELNPKAFFGFRHLTVDSLSKSTLKMKNTTEQKIVLSDFQASPEGVKCNLKGQKVILPGKEIEISISVIPKKEGPYSCSLKMKTSWPEIPELVIYGSGRAEVKAAGQ